MPRVLYFMGVKPQLEDGTFFPGQRCDCMDRANLQVEIVEGKIVFAGCPVCRREHVLEVSPDGSFGFFPPGVQVIG